MTWSTDPTSARGDARPGLGLHAEELTQQRTDALAVVGDLGRGEPGVELDVVVAVACAVADPAELLVDAVRRAVLGGRLVDLAGMDRCVDADDLGEAAGEPEQPRGAPTDEERGALGAVGPRGARQVGDSVVLAVVR